MADISPFSPADRRGLEQLYRRTAGTEAADRMRLRWDWSSRNPSLTLEPPYFVVREGPTIIAASPMTAVRATVRGQEVAGTWSADPLVVSERQRQGLGSSLLRAWDRSTGLALAAGLAPGTRELLDGMRWPRGVSLPCLVKPLSRRALRRPTWPVAVNRLVSAVTLPVIRVVSRTAPLKEEVQVVRRFDGSIEKLWERVGSKFDLAVRRDTRYVNWKFVEPPHVRYTSAVLLRGGNTEGYIVYRHSREPQGRVTQIVDFLTDPADEHGLQTLLGWVDHEARLEDSDKIRCYVSHAAFRRMVRRSGYFVVKSDIDLTAKVNVASVPKTFYDSCDAWHFTLGDGDLDS